MESGDHDGMIMILLDDEDNEDAWDNDDEDDNEDEDEDDDDDADDEYYDMAMTATNMAMMIFLFSNVRTLEVVSFEGSHCRASRTFWKGFLITISRCTTLTK